MRMLPQACMSTKHVSICSSNVLQGSHQSSAQLHGMTSTTPAALRVHCSARLGSMVHLLNCMHAPKPSSNHYLLHACSGVNMQSNSINLNPKTLNPIACFLSTLSQIGLYAAFSYYTRPPYLICNASIPAYLHACLCNLSVPAYARCAHVALQFKYSLLPAGHASLDAAHISHSDVCLAVVSQNLGVARGGRGGACKER